MIWRRDRIGKLAEYGGTANADKPITYTHATDHTNSNIFQYTSNSATSARHQLSSTAHRQWRGSYRNVIDLSV